MPNAFVEKLRGFGALTNRDVQLLEAATIRRQLVPAGTDLISEGSKPDPVFVVLEGWAFNYKILPGGDRQIIAFMMPGDFSDVHVSILAEVDHSITTLTDATISSIPRVEMEALVIAQPSLTKAFWWSQLVTKGVLRSTIASLGRRTSVERVAHLLCELFFRMRHVQLADSVSCIMPFTQIVLSDAVGLTPVHTNRVIRHLRNAGALKKGSGPLTISNISILAEIAGFDDNYLHHRLKQVN